MKDTEHEKCHCKKAMMLGLLLLVAGVMRYLNFSWAYVMMAAGIVLLLKSLTCKCK
jgi:small neutral amino acid transporter SnatA (MarC family)